MSHATKTTKQINNIKITSKLTWGKLNKLTGNGAQKTQSCTRSALVLINHPLRGGFRRWHA